MATTKRKDISKLVKVKRVVTKQSGLTYTTTLYIKPEDVGKTDKVIGNKEVYIEYLRGVKGKENVEITQELKDKVNNQPDVKKKVAILKKDLGRDGVFKLADKLGIKYNKAQNPDITWMKCNVELQKQFDAGFKLGDEKLKDMGSNKPKEKDSTPRETDSKYEPSDKGSTDETREKKDAKGSLPTLSLPKAVKNDIGKARSPREKIQVLKDYLGVDELIKTAKRFKIDWEETDIKPINWLKCNIALQVAIGKGLVLGEKDNYNTGIKNSEPEEGNKKEEKDIPDNVNQNKVKKE